MFQRYFLLTCLAFAAYCQTPVEPISPARRCRGKSRADKRARTRSRSSRGNSSISRSRRKAPIFA